jgi:Tfp pilus assembly protein PilF
VLDTADIVRDAVFRQQSQTVPIRAFSPPLKSIAAIDKRGYILCAVEVHVGTALTSFAARILFGALALSCAALAQGSGHRTLAPSPKASAPPPVPEVSTLDQQRIQRESSGAKPLSTSGNKLDTCLLPPLSEIQAQTIAVASLQIAPNAKKDYATGCGALRDRQYDKAEEKLRKAVKEDPNYPAAWVTLGQLLASRQKLEDARGACSKAQSVDPMYLPSYLCLADIAARSQNWEEMLSLSSHALQIDPTNDPLAYDYNAAANLKLHRLPDAEKSALKAIEIDRNHSDPRVHFVLAQIYEAEGDRSRETAQLQEYVKYASPSEAAAVKQYLSELETQQK